MEENAFIFRHWDDVVFENRNKSYGAYILRQAYAQRLLLGLGITIAMVVTILSLQHFYADREIAPPPVRTFDEHDFFLQPPPILQEKQRRPESSRPQKSDAKSDQVLVTTEEVPDTEVEAIADFIFDEGTDTGLVGIIDGVGTVPLVEARPIALPEVMEIAEVMPAYEGGLEAMMRFIRKKIRYPNTPRRMGIDGTVYVRFVVKGDGTVTDVEVIRGVHPDYDKEAVRVISMLPSWIGGRHNGRPVSVRMVLPIKFNLQQ